MMYNYYNCVPKLFNCNQDMTIYTNKFVKNFDNLTDWICTFHTLPSHKSDDKIEKKLGNFCKKQRKLYFENKLEQYKIDVFNDLMYWDWNEPRISKINTDKFDRLYEMLKSWIENTGKLPQKKSEYTLESKLARFCYRSKRKYKHNCLNQKSVTKLNALPQWTWEILPANRKHYKFDKNYSKLKEWLKHNDSFPSGSSKNQEERKLATFCCRMCSAYRRGKLDPEISSKLEGIYGWSWKKRPTVSETRREQLFCNCYNKLKQWITINGCMPRFRSSDLIERQLNHWCSKQKTRRNFGKLNDSMIQRLESLPNWIWFNKR